VVAIVDKMSSLKLVGFDDRELYYEESIVRFCRLMVML
jgi:hypothetical protein